MKADKHLKNAATTAMLIEAGFDMMRQNIPRRNANASEKTVERWRVDCWRVDGGQWTTTEHVEFTE